MVLALTPWRGALAQTQPSRQTPNQRIAPMPGKTSSVDRPPRFFRLAVAFCLFARLGAAQPCFAETPAPAPANPAPAAVNPAPATTTTKPAEAAHPAAAKPATPVMETPAVVMNGDAATTLLGKLVKSVNGGDLGRVVDLIADRNGTLRAAVIDFGGFLGVGTRKIAVDWTALHFPKEGGLDKLIADLPRDQLKNAPVFKEGEPIVVIGGPPIARPPAAAPPPGAPPPPKPASSPNAAPDNDGAAQPKR